MRLALSVIIPVYNAKDYISACVESLYLFHNHNPHLGMEIILVDDGSNDGSQAICDMYSHDNRNKSSFSVKVVHQVNSGVSSARNKGLELASGNWVWFVDADDYVEAEHVELPEADMIMFGCRWKQNGKADECYLHDDDYTTPKSHFLLSHSSYLNQTMWFKRELIERHNIRFTQGMRMGEDLEFQYKYLMVCSVPVSKSVILYNYRVIEGSATNNQDSRRNIVHDSSLFFYNIHEFIKKNAIREEVWLADRLGRQMKTMLYSGGLVSDYSRKELQKVVRGIMDGYSDEGYKWMHDRKLKLAYLNVSLYILLNKVYLKIKRQS